MVNGGSSSQQSTQSSESFRNSATFQQAMQAGYFGDLYSRGQQRSGEQLDYFGGQNFATMGAPTAAGIAGINQVAAAGGGELGSAQGYNEDVLAGNYLNANPYLDATFDAAARGVTRAFKTGAAPGAQSAFEAAGRGSSGSARNAQSQVRDEFGRNLGELATSIYGGNYQAERGRMGEAASRAGGLAGAQQSLDLGRYGAQINAGGIGEGFQREQIAGDIQRFDYGRDEMDQRLAKYRGLLGPSVMESRDTAESRARGQSTGESMNFGIF